jgi:hypothetical protein
VAAGMTVSEIKVGDVVRFRRADYWQTGEVVHLGRYVAHIRAGDDFLGYHVFVENLKVLQSQQTEEK